MRIAIVDDERPARSELRHQIQELLKEAEIVEGRYIRHRTCKCNSQYAATGKNYICDSLFRICS